MVFALVTYISGDSDVGLARKQVEVKTSESGRGAGYELNIGPVFRSTDPGENGQ